MPIIDLVDRDGCLIGRDTVGIETDDGYFIQIRDGDAAIRVIPVPMFGPNIPMDMEVANILDIGAII